jgi:hypothetical protein
MCISIRKIDACRSAAFAHIPPHRDIPQTPCKSLNLLSLLSASFLHHSQLSHNLILPSRSLPQLLHSPLLLALPRLPLPSQKTPHHKIRKQHSDQASDNSQHDNKHLGFVRGMRVGAVYFVEVGPGDAGEVGVVVDASGGAWEERRDDGGGDDLERRGIGDA